MELLSLIRKKRAGGELSAAELEEFTAAVVDGSAPDYQLSALLMAICYEGLSYAETLALTRAFVASGEQLSWPEAQGPVVDKHSTGGVGDKVSLLLVPWLAAVGLVVPKMSGRGLGHTGGTIDKLASVPGFRVALSQGEIRAILADVGCVVVAQSAGLVPADKRLYALRDVTDTVDQLGLIAASVLSKKTAAGAEHIVLDVKCGSGAFFKDLARAREFAELALSLGRDLGRGVACVISNMHQPLGSAVGNALEVEEVLALLAGERDQPDLTELCQILGALLLTAAGRTVSMDEGQAMMEQALAGGAVRERFERWIAAQGGDLAAFRERHRDGYRRIDVRAVNGGYLRGMDAQRIGELARGLGAGRLTAADGIDAEVGILCRCKVGDAIEAEQSLAELVARAIDPRSDRDLAEEYVAALSFGAEPPEVKPVVLDVLLP
jgi:pyrimidine-nucleoside phosphorylase